MPIQDADYENGYRLSDSERDAVRAVELEDGWEELHEADDGFLMFEYDVEGDAFQEAGIGPLDEGDGVKFYLEEDGELVGVLEGDFEGALKALKMELQPGEGFLG